MISRRLVAAAALLLLAGAARAQTDPKRRSLIQLGVDQGLSGGGPEGAYLFYYVNRPDVPWKGSTLRAAVAPVYLDTELTFREALAGSDVGIHVDGGGFADSYDEVRRGEFLRGESFVGHGGGMDLDLYRRLNPGQRIPLNLVLRGGAHATVYKKGRYTDADFSLPPDHVDYRFRAALRLGGKPPELDPPRAAELSFWYEARDRNIHGSYGFNGDRALSSYTRLYWTRLLFYYRMKSADRFSFTAEAGTSDGSDRVDAYRLGGMLPFSSEFPLSIPGYYNGELTARRYGLLSGRYGHVLNDARSTEAHAFFGAANVGYLDGLGQPTPWNLGAGVGVGFDAKRWKLWRTEIDYAYGIDAIRSGRRGAHSVAVMVQLDLEAIFKHTAVSHPSLEPNRSEGTFWLRELLPGVP